MTYKKSKRARQLEEYLRADQRGRCALCGVEGAPLYLDHCHTTKRYRGLLCTGCNSMLSMRLEKIGLEAIAQYLTHYYDIAFDPPFRRMDKDYFPHLVRGRK